MSTQQTNWPAGPWSFYRAGDQSPDSIWLGDGYGSVRVSWSGYENPAIGSGVRAAARLMSAAPDLYKALEAILFEDRDKSEGERVRDRVMAHLALSKARGED